MKHLEKPDMQKLSTGEQDILAMVEAMVVNWNKYQQGIKDEKIKSTVNKKIKNLIIIAESAKVGLLYQDTILVQEYGGLWIFFQEMDKGEDYNIESIVANTSERISIFIKYQDTFFDEEYWKNLGSDYQLQNYEKIPYSTYYKLFLSPRKQKQKLMNAEELEFFYALPDKFTIYRGGTESEAKNKMYGVSWTINKAIAEQFQNVKAMRDSKPMVIHELEINKSEVIAYFNEREEEEIIYIHPKHYLK